MNKKIICKRKSCEKCPHCTIGVQGYGRTCEKFGKSALTEAYLWKGIQELQKNNKGSAK